MQNMSTYQPLSTVVNLYALLQTKVLSDGKNQCESYLGYRRWFVCDLLFFYKQQVV